MLKKVQTACNFTTTDVTQETWDYRDGNWKCSAKLMQSTDLCFLPININWMLEINQKYSLATFYSLFPSSHDRTESKTADSPVRRPADFICFNSVPFANQLMLKLMSLVFFLNAFC